MNNLNYAYKASIKVIENNDYEEKVYNELMDKLNELKNNTLDYYTKIKDSYYLIRNYLKKSINEVNTLLNKCANITYQTFADYYENIAKKVQSINNEQYEYDEIYKIEKKIFIPKYAILY